MYLPNSMNQSENMTFQVLACCSINQLYHALHVIHLVVYWTWRKSKTTIVKNCTPYTYNWIVLPTHIFLGLWNTVCLYNLTKETTHRELGKKVSPRINFLIIPARRMKARQKYQHCEGLHTCCFLKKSCPASTC